LAKFWATFSQTHLVTLLWGSHSCLSSSVPAFFPLSLFLWPFLSFYLYHRYVSTKTMNVERRVADVFGKSGRIWSHYPAGLFLRFFWFHCFLDTGPRSSIFYTGPRSSIFYKGPRSSTWLLFRAYRFLLGVNNNNNNNDDDDGDDDDGVSRS
jgi:hypothetical protein